jgi:hypothetical protein
MDYLVIGIVIFLMFGGWFITETLKAKIYAKQIKKELDK